MSNRKTRKQKLKAEQRKNNNPRVYELKKLKERKIQLERQIPKQRLENFKQFNIRNLKIFGSTCNFVTPFVVSTGVTIGTFFFLGGGLPIHTDQIIEYNEYNLDYETNGDTIMEEAYRKDGFFDSSESNKLIVYTPWEYKDEQYTRYRRVYNISSVDTLDLFDAVLDQDYDYVKENLKHYSEEMQITNYVDNIEDNNYYFEASLHMLDKEDTLKYDETVQRNAIITIIEIILVLGIGCLVTHFRNFDYLASLRETNNNYRYKTYDVRAMQKELELINEKILSLSINKGGKNNEK